MFQIIFICNPLEVIQLDEAGTSFSNQRLELQLELKIPLRLGSKTRVLAILALPQSHCAHISGQQTWGCAQLSCLLEEEHKSHKKIPLWLGCKRAIDFVHMIHSCLTAFYKLQRGCCLWSIKWWTLGSHFWS